MTLAIIAGAGALPAALVAALPERPFIAALDGFPPEGLAPDLTFRIERLFPFFAALHDAGIRRIAFAGAVRRPRLDPALFDTQTAQIVPRLMQSLAQGDDATLREVIALFEEEGFEIIGAAGIAPALVPPEGLYAGALTPRDQLDATRAAAITEALGRVDVGQGCVVAQGICLAAETIAGTDAMLEQVAALPRRCARWFRRAGGFSTRRQSRCRTAASTCPPLAPPRSRRWRRPVLAASHGRRAAS
ncbi:hypothetical protein MASR1M32_25320 [Rhodobacter sp.]